MNKLTRVTRDMRRVVAIDGRPHVLTIGVHGLTIRRLRARQATAVPVRWADLLREGGILDAAELASRPLLAACMRRGLANEASRAEAVEPLGQAQGRKRG